VDGLTVSDNDAKPRAGGHWRRARGRALHPVVRLRDAFAAPRADADA